MGKPPISSNLIAKTFDLQAIGEPEKLQMNAPDLECKGWEVYIESALGIDEVVTAVQLINREHKLWLRLPIYSKFGRCDAEEVIYIFSEPIIDQINTFIGEYESKVWLDFGWWYVKFLFTCDPMEAFSIFADEYRKQIDDNKYCVDIALDNYRLWEHPQGIVPAFLRVISGFYLKANHQLRKLMVSVKIILSRFP